MDELQRLREANARLRDRVEQLEDALFGAVDEPLPLEWRLTPSEARLFRALCVRPLCGKEYLLLAACDALDSGDAPEVKIVDVLICKMRKKLAPYGVEVKTCWGQGYMLDDATRARFKPKGLAA